MLCSVCQSKVEANVASAYESVQDQYEIMCEECLGQCVLGLLRWMELAGLASCVMDEERTIQ